MIVIFYKKTPLCWEMQSFESKHREIQPMFCPVIAAWLFSSFDPSSEINISSLPISYPILNTHNSHKQTIITQIVILLN